MAQYLALTSHHGVTQFAPWIANMSVRCNNIFFSFELKCPTYSVSTTHPSPLSTCPHVILQNFQDAVTSAGRRIPPQVPRPTNIVNIIIHVRLDLFSSWFHMKVVVWLPRILLDNQQVLGNRNSDRIDSRVRCGMCYQRGTMPTNVRVMESYKIEQCRPRRRSKTWKRWMHARSQTFNTTSFYSSSLMTITGTAISEKFSSVIPSFFRISACFVSM